MRGKLWFYSFVMLVVTLSVGIWQYDGQCIEQDDYLCIEEGQIVELRPGDTTSLWARGLEVKFQSADGFEGNYPDPAAYLSSEMDNVFIRDIQSGGLRFVADFSFTRSAKRYYERDRHQMGKVIMTVKKLSVDDEGPVVTLLFLPR